MHEVLSGFSMIYKWNKDFDCHRKILSAAGTNQIII